METPLATLPLLFGLILIIAALLMLIFPPKKPNGIYGYRTQRSMKDQKHWDFAQRYSTKIMMLMGLASMAFSSAGWLFNLNTGVGVSLGLGWIILVCILLIARVEKALKKEFGD